MMSNVFEWFRIVIECISEALGDGWDQWFKIAKRPPLKNRVGGPLL